jgi:hypothetical protein
VGAAFAVLAPSSIAVAHGMTLTLALENVRGAQRTVETASHHSRVRLTFALTLETLRCTHAAALCACCYCRWWRRQTCGSTSHERIPLTRMHSRHPVRQGSIHSPLTRWIDSLTRWIDSLTVAMLPSLAAASVFAEGFAAALAAASGACIVESR